LHTPHRSAPPQKALFDKIDTTIESPLPTTRKRSGAPDFVTAKTRDCALAPVGYVVREWIGSNLWRWGLWPPRLRACFGGVFARVDFPSNAIRTAVAPPRPKARWAIPSFFTLAKVSVRRLP
jgi:hypothetical protein